MDAVECITSRQSIRAFLPDPVPREVLTEVFATARWSPSYKNSQPWEAVVLSGEKKTDLSEMMVSLLEQGTATSPDLTEPTSWPETQQERINHLFRKRAEATGFDLSDPAVIHRAKVANFRFYGAPHAIYLFQDASLTPWSLFDLGLFAQSLMLAAHARGLGTVPQAFATDYAREVKEFLDIPADKRLVLGLSVGYPDRDAPANSLRTDRADTGELVRWIE